MPGVHNDLVDPAQMMIRGFHFWQQTRWPGRNARLRYAHTLFNLYLLRCLELLSMRLWDAGSSTPGERLAQLQEVLDELWKGTPGDQPVLVRNACWLIPLAQSPTTDELAAYFAVAKLVAETLSPTDQLEIQKASVQIRGHVFAGRRAKLFVLLPPMGGGIAKIHFPLNLHCLIALWLAFFCGCSCSKKFFAIGDEALLLCG